MASSTKRAGKTISRRRRASRGSRQAMRLPTTESFADFLARREEVSNAYIQGDAAPLLEMSVDSDPATFFPPSGERVVGVRKVNAANEKGAANFGQGSTGKFEVFQSGSSGDLGFWTGIQHADMVMKGKKDRVKMQLRVTEVFRRVNGAWKLAHRHADMTQPKGELR